MSKLQTEPILNVNSKTENTSDAKDNKNKAANVLKSKCSQLDLTVQEAELNGQKSNDKFKEENLSAEELAMLQMENEQIFKKMSTMVDEIKQLEGKIVEISRLQYIFTEKVLEQEKDIDKVADNVVMTTENIKEANEVIREAMKNNAGLRVWILFFLIVCTLSLLFLDWYNI